MNPADIHYYIHTNVIEEPTTRTLISHVWFDFAIKNTIQEKTISSSHRFFMFDYHFINVTVCSQLSMHQNRIAQ
jgi:hypothetical protein